MLHFSKALVYAVLGRDEEALTAYESGLHCSAAEKLEDPIREYDGVKESRNDDTKTPQIYGTVQV
jgi:hypothetical protein